MAKLYELIEQGSKLVSEDHNTYLRRGTLLTKPLCGCVLGMAFVVLQKLRGMPIWTRSPMKIYDVINEAVPHTLHLVRYPCSCRPAQPIELAALVDHLHKDHEWPWEQIVNWLRPIEDEMEQTQLEFEQEKVAELVLA